jgi:hypothetical protein
MLDKSMNTTQFVDYRRNSSVSAIPAAPVLRPQRLPSIVDPATRRTSWRLSFALQRRGSQLRALSRECTPPLESGGSIKKVPAIETTPFEWLRVQGYRLSSQAVSDSSEYVGNLNTLPSHQDHCGVADDFGGVDGCGESQQASIHLQEMNISQCLASRGLHSAASSPQLSSWGSHTHHRFFSVTSSESRFSTIHRSRHYKMSSSGGVQRANPKNCQKVGQDGTSSFYASNNNSVLQMPNSSLENLPSLLLDFKKDNSSVQASEPNGRSLCPSIGTLSIFDMPSSSFLCKSCT